MKNKKAEGLILILTGLIIIACGLFIFFLANTSFPNSDSPRVQDLNWLLNSLGKTGTAILICSIGILPLYIGIKRLLTK